VNDAIRLVALDVAAAAAGATLVVLVGMPVRRSWLPTIAGVALATGLAVFGLLSAAGAMVGLDVGVAATVLLAVVALAGGFLVLSRRPRRPTLGSLAPPSASGVALVAEAALLAVLALLSIRIVRLAAATDLYAWDGWALWAPKAHALFVEGDVWGPVFREPEYSMQHLEYPILLPALEAVSASALGRFDPTLIDVQAAAVLAGFGWAAWAILRLVVMPIVAAAVAVALTGLAPLIDNVVATYADSVVASFTALGVLCAIVWLSTGASPVLALGGVFLAAAASTKSEGLLFALAAIVALGVAARGTGRPIRSVLLFAGGVLLLPAVWAIVDRLNGPGAKNVDTAALVDPGYLADEADRIPTAASRLLTEMLEAWPIALLAFALATAAACAARLWWPAIFLALWGTLSFAALVGVYFTSTNPIDWLLTTSADRVVFSIVLGAATSAPVLVGLAWERARLVDAFRERSAPRDIG
jgi:hypothetical protein